MEAYNDFSARFLEVVDEIGISDYKLWNSMEGLSKATMSKIRCGRSGVSMNVFSEFVIKYPNVNPDYILTGRGDKLKGKSKEDFGGILPIAKSKTKEKILSISEFNLYDLDVSAGLSRLFSEDGDQNKAFLGKISVPNMPRCDGAVKVIGDSMYPLLKSGDIIAYKEVHSMEAIQWGEIYILQLEYDSDISVVVKYVKKSDQGNDYINLVSYNKEHDPKDVRKENITAMARVMLCIRQMSVM